MGINSKISVLIPTCNRPEFLRTALGSVLAQSFLHRVVEVVVIENGGTRLSAQVCAQFPTLPIRYVFRDPPLPAERTARPALAEVHQDIVALLCDDDWWSNYHLESACRLLDDSPDGVAYFCNALFTQSEDNSYVDHLYHAWLPWFAAKGKAADGVCFLSFIDMLIATLITTPFHFSSMVVNRSAWLKCLHIFDDGNPADVDRLLELELSKHGAIIFDGHPGVYVRSHAGQEVIRLNKSGEADKWFNRSTLRILDYARESRIDVKKEFADRLSVTGNNIGRLSQNSVYGSVKLLESRGLLPPVIEPDEILRARATIAALEKAVVERENEIETILNSRTFRLGLRIRRFRELISKFVPCISS